MPIPCADGYVQVPLTARQTQRANLSVSAVRSGPLANSAAFYVAMGGGMLSPVEPISGSCFVPCVTSLDVPHDKILSSDGVVTSVGDACICRSAG